MVKIYILACPTMPNSERNVACMRRNYKINYLRRGQKVAHATKKCCRIEFDYSIQQQCSVVECYSPNIIDSGKEKLAYVNIKQRIMFIANFIINIYIKLPRSSYIVI